MNTLILNRETFELARDGWYQIAPLGEFAHAATGVVQVVDRAACEAMVNRFGEEAGTQPFDKLRAERFAGLLVDFDHFSLDGEKRSEAAGWIVALEYRAPKAETGKLKAEMGNTSRGDAEERDHGSRLQRNSAAGGAGPAAERSARCGAGLWAKIRWSDLGEDAVKGGRYRFLSPVWSRSDCVEVMPNAADGKQRLRPVRLLNAAVTNDPNLKGMVPLSNRGTDGRPETGDRRPASRKPATAEGAEGVMANADSEKRFKWVLGESPDDRHCPSCSARAGQVHTMTEWDAAGGGPGGNQLYCQGNCHCSLVETDEAASGELRTVPTRLEQGTQLLPNIGWRDEARAASLAVRRAKAARRKRNAEKPETADQRPKTGPDSRNPATAEQLDELRMALGAKQPELTPEQRQLLEDLAESGYAGESDGDPIFQWMERESMQEQATQRLAPMDEQEASDYAAELEQKELEGEELRVGEKRFLDLYRELMGNRAVEPSAHCTAGRAGEPSAHCTAGRAGEQAHRLAGRGRSHAGAIANVWSDAARAAALAVRRAKATSRNTRPTRAPGTRAVGTEPGRPQPRPALPQAGPVQAPARVPMQPPARETEDWRWLTQDASDADIAALLRALKARVRLQAEDARR